jgi:hypothetical protein
METEHLFLRAPEQGKIDPAVRAATVKSWGWRPSTIVSTILGDKNPSGISRRTDRRSMPSRLASSQFSDLSDNQSKSARCARFGTNVWTRRAATADPKGGILQDLSAIDFARSIKIRSDFASLISH